MKRMLLTIAYDGTDFHGWQVQPNGITVQETLQNSLENMLGVRPDVTGCSRTDAGVHAKMFCCHFDCDDRIPERAFEKGLNSLLPKSVAVLSCKETDKDFHARYSSKGKTYIYKILNSCVPNPFIMRYAWQIERSMHLEKINEFCRQIVGTHDFSGFSSSGRSVTDTVRTVKNCSCIRDGDMLLFEITADGFLYNMVRIIVGTAVGVSDGKIGISDINRIFADGDRSLAGVTAPPQGLCLYKVIY